jgi:hypothetical protein
MNEKALMRKTKAELLKILRARGKKPDPKTLKKDLVRLVVKSEPAPEKAVKKKPERKAAKTQKGRRKKAADKPLAAVAASIEETISATDAAGRAQPRAEEMKRATEMSFREETPQPPPAELHNGREKPAEYEAAAEPPGSSTLSRRYGEDRIAAMVRDPYWIFAYWEVTPPGLEHARCKLDGEGESANLALRVYDVSGVEFTGKNANSSFDIEVGGNTDNWYINTGSPGRSYCVDIGLSGRDGLFLTIARSECVSTPRATPSDKVDDRWMSPEGEFEQVYALSGGLETGAASLDLHELMEKQLQARMSS